MESGPTEHALKGFVWLQNEWSEVLELFEEQACQFYAPYADAVPSVPKFETSEQFWETSILLSVRVFSTKTYSVTMRFTWQEDDDPHEITFYVEDGVCLTHTVDG